MFPFAAFWWFIHDECVFQMAVLGSLTHRPQLSVYYALQTYGLCMAVWNPMGPSLNGNKW